MTTHASSLVVRRSWTPKRLPSLRLWINAQKEAKRNSLTPATIADCFSRADSASDLGSAYVSGVATPWTIWNGTWGITSQRAYFAVLGTDNRGEAVLNSGVADHVVRALIITPTTGGSPASNYRGLILRGIDVDNCLHLILDMDLGFLQLAKRDGGVRTGLQNGTTALVAGNLNKVRVECHGNTIDVYLDSVLEFSYTLTGGDATKFNAAGCTYVGICARSAISTSRYYENFQVFPYGVSSFARLATIHDESGNGFDFSQSTDANKPTLLHDGKRWVFSPPLTTGIMIRSSIDISSASLGFACYAMPTPPTLAGAYVFASADEGTSTRYWGITADGSSAGKARITQRNGDTADDLSGDSNIAAGTALLVDWRSDGATYVGNVNGVQQALTAGSGANTGDWFGDTSNRDNFTLFGLKRFSGEGSQIGPSCLLTDLILCDSVPSSDDRKRLRRWLNLQRKLGIAGI